MLPTKPIPASRKNPARLVIYGKPKCGKTTLVSKLERTLILDFENGTEFIDAVKVSIIGLSAPSQEKPEAAKQRRDEQKQYYVSEVLAEVRAHKQKTGQDLYDKVVIDTGTKLEEYCEPVATWDYMNTTVGAKFNRDAKGAFKPRNEWESCLSLPMGAGYKYLRDVFMRWIDLIGSYFKDTIVVCHVKDKNTNKDGKEIISQDLNLTGKIGQILAAYSDAIGFIYRKKNETRINFASTDDTCGSRCEHLKGQDLLLMEEDKKTGEVKTYWDSIYLDDIKDK